MTTFRFLNFELHTSLEQLDFSKTPILVNTINPHSYCVTKKDKLFCEALEKSDILIPDGMGIVWAAKLLSGEIINRITGADLHRFLLTKLNHTEGKVFYLGSSSSVLEKFEDRLKKEYPNIKFAGYSPPYKPEFSEEENSAMVDAVNNFKPHVVFVGMTAPKQEKWAYQNKERLDTNIIASIGAVFDFYAGTVKRAPKWMQHSLPIVSTFEGGIRDIVDDGETGFLVPQKDVAALSEKLEYLILNGELRQQIGIAGRVKYEKEYTLNTFEIRIKEILNKILSK